MATRSPCCTILPVQAGWSLEGLEDIPNAWLVYSIVRVVTIHMQFLLRVNRVTTALKKAPDILRMTVFQRAAAGFEIRFM